MRDRTGQAWMASGRVAYVVIGPPRLDDENHARMLHPVVLLDTLERKELAEWVSFSWEQLGIERLASEDGP